MAREAIIIGAGVIGMASAYALASRGWSVTLVDKADGPAMGTSHSNGAQLSYCFTDALGSPATMAAMPRLVLANGGVSFRLGLSPDYLRWLLAFARNCTSARFRENTLAVYALAQQSRAAMEAVCERHDLDFGHRVAGKINLVYGEKQLNRAREVMAIKGEAGCEQHYVPRAELAQLDKGLLHLDPAVTGAVSTPSEVVGDPYLFCAALLPVLERVWGVVPRFGCVVSSLEEANGGARVTLANGEVLEADVAVVAGGPDSNRLLAPLGQAEMIQPMKGYSFEIPAIPASPHISVTDPKHRIVFTRLGGKMRVAGIAELGRASRDIDPARIDWLIKGASTCMPEGGNYEAAGKFWSGIRPATPNSQPVIRRASRGIAINSGHGALGWTLAMGSGERLADLLDQP